MSAKPKAVFLFFLLQITSIDTFANQDDSDHLDIVTQTKITTASEDAFASIYRLNQDKNEIYSQNLTLFQKNLLNQHPVILALFSSKGGNLTLYRPHHAPLQAPRVSQEYEIVKSIGHSTLALYSFFIPFVSNQKNTSWKPSLENFLLHNQKALDSIDDLSCNSKIKADIKSVLKINIKFMTDRLQDQRITLDSVKDYTKSQSSNIKILLTYATQLQVGHWIDVLNDWKNLLGDDFNKTYAAVSSVYVTRNRNVLFTVLAQFFRTESFNDRLFLFETTDFAITPENVLGELTRVISDRAIGELFFGGKYEMDVELLGAAARVALQENSKKLPGPILLPPLRPAHDLQRWPW